MNPSPAMLATMRPVAAKLDPEAPAKVVRPEHREVVVVTSHDGVIKAKKVEPGMEIRAWLHGQPKGSLRVVDTVEVSGATVHVTFSSPHPPTDYKAAYRLYVEDLVGTPVQTTTTVSALVAYEEV